MNYQIFDFFNFFGFIINELVLVKLIKKKFINKYNFIKKKFFFIKKLKFKKKFFYFLLSIIYIKYNFFILEFIIYFFLNNKELILIKKNYKLKNFKKTKKNTIFKLIKIKKNMFLIICKFKKKFLLFLSINYFRINAEKSSFINLLKAILM